jgi:hypothetical protein
LILPISVSQVARIIGVKHHTRHKAPYEAEVEGASAPPRKMLMLFEDGGGPHRKKCQRPLEGQGNTSSLQRFQKKPACQHLDFSPAKLILNF